MRLSDGQRAPDFELPMFPSGKFRLSARHAGTKAWLMMLRFAGCPFCNLQIHLAITHHPALEAAGVLPIAVFAAPLDDLAEHAGRQQAPFPLLADGDRRVHDLYGTSSSLLGALDPRNASAMLEARSLARLGGPMRGAATLMPADFLVDEAGVIARAAYGTRSSEHLGVDEVLAWARERAAPSKDGAASGVASRAR